MSVNNSLKKKGTKKESIKGIYGGHHNLQSRFKEDNDYQTSIVLQFDCEHQEGKISSGLKRTYTKKIYGLSKER